MKMNNPGLQSGVLEHTQSRALALTTPMITYTAIPKAGKVSPPVGGPSISRCLYPGLKSGVIQDITPSLSQARLNLASHGPARSARVVIVLHTGQVLKF